MKKKYLSGVFLITTVLGLTIPSFVYALDIVPGPTYVVGGPCSTFANGAGYYDASGNCIPSDSISPSGTPTPSQGTGGNTPVGTGASGNTPVGTGPSQSGGGTVTLVNPLGTGATLNSFLQGILQIVIQIGTVVIILMIVYVGYLFVVAQGNESKLSEAKRALLWTVIGALVLLGAQAIAIGIQATVNAISVGK